MKRYIALDAMRGLTIAAMILVNTPGDWSYVYAPLLHSHWHGLTATDLVFPFFLFIIGSAMFFAFKKIGYQYSTQAFKHIVKRSFIIFLLGLFLNAFPDVFQWQNLRIMGVLQRIALCYFVASVAILWLSGKQLKIFTVLLIALYAALLSVSGYQLTGNVVQWFDLKTLSAQHMYALHGAQFDPEGLLSSLPGIASMLIGFEVTKLLTQCTNPLQGLKKLLLLAIGFLLAGYVLSFSVPINKSLWTSSYVLVSSGYACLVLAFFVLITDVLFDNRQQQERLMFPLLVYGLNPLFIYVVSWLWESCYKLIDITLVDGSSIHLGQYLQLQLTQVFEPINASFIYAISHVFLFWLMSLWLYKKRIIIKI